jgi:hypothetical protein
MKGLSSQRAIGVAALGAMLIALVLASTSIAGPYPPVPDRRSASPQPGDPPAVNGIIFTNTHLYGSITIRVDVYDNYFGDFTKYWWVYSVTNLSYDPNPGTSNGFSGFETALPMPVPDIADVATPGPGWIIDCCSGLPVEYDINQGNGVMPGFSGIFSFTTAPRLIVPSTGWFHTWEFGSQTNIITYPIGDEPEVPDVLSNPGQELCCYKDATGAYICQILPAGQCTFMGGSIVSTCNNCPPITPTDPKTWGDIKELYRR